MKLKITIGLMMIFNFVYGQHKYQWLEGTWKMIDKNVYEVWKNGSNSHTLYGKSFKINGSDTLLLEEIILVKEKETYYYKPKVAENKTVVSFKITSGTDSSFVAENPTHDFPKLIQYTIVRKGENAFIEASISGTAKVISYSFEKIK